MELISHHQQGEFRKGQKVTPRVQPPPRILVTDIHLGRARHEPLGRTLSQNDCLKTTRKQIPVTRKPEAASHVAKAVLLGSLTLLLSAWAPFPNKISCFVSTCVCSDNSIPSVRQEPTFGPWKGFPFLQQNDKLP